MRAGLATALQLGAYQLDVGSDLLTPDQIDAGQDSLAAFIGNINYKYEINWHHAQLVEALEMVQRGEITRMIVMMPSRHGKSEHVSRYFPAYCLGKDSDEKIISCSYSATLAGDMGIDVQNIMATDEYQAMFSTRLKSGVEAKKGSKKVKETNLRFDMVNGDGYYIGAGVGGPITGRGFSLGIIDDYCKNREEAESKTFRDRLWNWYTSTFYSRSEGRLSSGGCDRIIICATPWHEDDLISRILNMSKETGEVWHVIRFPNIKENDDDDAGIYESSSMFVDPREEGEALWPKVKTVEELDIIRKQSPLDWPSLRQCRPTKAGGNIFKKQHWQLYDELPKGHLIYTFSLDCAFKDGESGSFVVLQLWAAQGPDHYLVEQWRGKRDYTETKSLCNAKFAQYPKARTKLIEDKANGPAVINELGKRFSGIVPITPKGSKVARAMAIQGMVEAGNVYLPRHADWRETFESEHASFPNGKNDDQVDAMTQYLERGTNSMVDLYSAFSKVMVG